MMKTWMTIALIMCVAAFAEAEEQKAAAGEKKAKALTKEVYVARVKAKAEAAGKEFDQAKIEASFDKRDLDKDGVLSKAEKNAGTKKKKKKAE